MAYSDRLEDVNGIFYLPFVFISAFGVKGGELDWARGSYKYICRRHSFGCVFVSCFEE